MLFNPFQFVCPGFLCVLPPQVALSSRARPRRLSIQPAAVWRPLSQFCGKTPDRGGTRLLTMVDHGHDGHGDVDAQRVRHEEAEEQQDRHRVTAAPAVWKRRREEKSPPLLSFLHLNRIDE